MRGDDQELQKAVSGRKFRKVETIRYLGLHIAKNLGLKPGKYEDHD